MAAKSRHSGPFRTPDLRYTFSELLWCKFFMVVSMDKRLLSERDICSKFILPALTDAGWDLNTQISEEKSLTAGRIVVRGKLVARGKK